MSVFFRWRTSVAWRRVNVLEEEGCNVLVNIAEAEHGQIAWGILNQKATLSSMSRLSRPPIILRHGDEK